VEQVEVDRALGLRRYVGLVWKSGRRILGGKTRDVKGRLHRLFDGRNREVRGARVAAPAANIDRHRQALVAVALHIFQLPLAHRHTETAPLGGFCRRITGAKFLRAREGKVHQLLKKDPAVTKAACDAGLVCIHLLGFK